MVLLNKARQGSKAMYNRDCVAIMSHAQASTDGLLDVVAFTLSTIQTPLKRCLDQVQDIRVNGEEAKALWGAKRGGYVYAQRNIKVLWEALHEAMALGDTEGAILAMASVPGLGMVKASFVCQMFGFDVACLDTHNLKRLGLESKDVKLDNKLKYEVKLKKVTEYVRLCRDTGGSEFWWNEWCNYVAAKGGLNKGLDSGDVVSAYHVKCVIG